MSGIVAIVCDSCGVNLDEWTEQWFSTAADAREQAKEHDWSVDGREDKCPDCVAMAEA